MAGIAYGSFAVGDANIDNVMLQTAAVEVGHCALTLTEMTTTNIPQIAAGSKIEVNGTLFNFASNETISGSATAGTNYIYITAAGVPTWTATAPTWFDSKQGWYTAAGTSRYIPFKVLLSSGSYSKFAPVCERGLLSSADVDITTGATKTSIARITSLQLENGAYNGNTFPLTSNLTSPASFFLKHPVSAHLIHYYTGPSTDLAMSLQYNPPGSNVTIFSIAINAPSESRYIALNPGNYILTWVSGETFAVAHPHGVYKNYTLSDIIS